MAPRASAGMADVSMLDSDSLAPDQPAAVSPGACLGCRALARHCCAMGQGVSICAIFSLQKSDMQASSRVFYTCCDASYVSVAAARLLTYNDLSMGRLSSVRL